MRRYADRAGLVRRGASLLLALVLGATPALAGDRALIDFIGYSPQGEYFAFEEFGIQDGSGFPYSTIYVLDLAADTWVKGTPVSVRLEEDAATLGDARAQSAQEAEALLARLSISEPAELLVANGDGPVEPNFRRLRFGAPGYGQGEPLSDQVLRLDTFESTSPLPCADWFSRPPQGMALSMEEDVGERLIHRDKRVPASRGCPVEYRLYGVVQPGWRPDIGSAVAIISVYSSGFEGADRRFVAVPIGR